MAVPLRVRRKRMFPKSENVHNYLNHHIMFNKERNLILFMTPKAGNSSVKRSILEGMPNNEGRLESFEWLSPANASYLRKKYNSHAIGLSRHPITRLMSCWANKICGHGEEIGSWHPTIKRSMTFDDFVQAVCKLNWSECDMHFRSQSEEMFHQGEKLVDKIFKMEELFTETGWPEFVEYLRPFDIYISNKYHLNKSTAESFEVSELTAELIRIKYRDDFINLDYT